jgi:flagellar basal-body rod protein FlgF
MAAAAARAEQLDSIADNLANAETPGFKSTRPAFQSFLPGGRRSDKVFTAAVATGVDLSPGTINATDNPLDIVPNDGAFLGVVTSTGQLAFTRHGQLQQTADGSLTALGRPIVGIDGLPVMLPPDSLGRTTIKEDGRVMVAGQEVGALGLFSLQGNVSKLGSSLIIPGAGGQAVPVAEDARRVRVGELEMGNSTPLEAAVDMITAQRQFETAMQAIQTYRKLDDRALEVGRVR